ncbi:hypothetical protein FHR83_000434 [Actinoplanes campanulatus]|uniref:Uncharacterized protein n=1 Tax=Actinoplanes campanulatus TaxID=113559 RepID=A0A7W5FC34_9ACTN|nr:hypothetical protein [Actinoplanes campanulatus]MBB3092800.1 hypothetical protein [Actinoplanes campanulatus]GGM99110.1 hypothetical protein GCM10010109_03620 [Actinoplanes campanulatus]GID34103.1 hypothetical protein Aca09nite_06090 [Actinoplanes campanulatus]
MRLSDDGLRAALRSEAAAHQPDREAMLDRISTAAMQDSGRRRTPRRGPRVRMATVVAAVVVLFGGGGVGTWALANSIDRDEATPAPTVAPTTDPTPTSVAPATTGPTPSRTTPTRKPTSAAPPPAPTKAQPGGTRVEQGPLWSDGSVDPDSGDTSGASVVTLKTTAELRTLEVVIRVARTDGLTSRGGTKSTPGASVTTTVTEEPGAFLYRFTLASADRLAPGTYTFTAKYAHPTGGRDAGGDTYEATSGALRVNGDFS